MAAPFPTTLDLVYDVAPVGPVSMAQLLAALAAVSLPTQDVLSIGVTLTSDTTINFAGLARRDLKFSLLPPFKPSTVPAPPEAPGTFRGSLVSSSPNDVQGGSGCQQFRIDYLDQDFLPQYEIVTPNGTTPQNLTSKKKVTITQITPTIGSPSGLIYVFSGLAGTGLLLGIGTGPIFGSTLQNFQGSIVSSNPNDTLAGIGAQTIKITYLDKTGAGPFTENVNLNGTTPVDLVNLNHATITNMELVSVGAFGSSCGIISIFTGLGQTGGLAGFLGQSFFQFFPQQTVVAAAIVPPNSAPQSGSGGGSSAYVVGAGGVTPVPKFLGTPTNVSPDSPPNQPAPLNVPPGTIIAADTSAPFRGIYTQIIGAALVSQVIARDPVFS